MLSPDGSQVAYVAATHNLAKDVTESHIWVVDYDGRNRHQLTDAAGSTDTLPQWTPDGVTIFYLSDSGDSGAQIWSRPATGGAAHQLTHLPEGVSDFALSPDGRRLALIAMDPKPKVPEGHAEAPFVTERYQFADDELGALDERRQHLYVADASGADPVLLTPGAHDEWLPAWSPDGGRVAFVTKREGDPDRSVEFDIYTVEARPGGAEHRLTTFPGSNDDPYWGSRPAWSPDGKSIAYIQGGPPHWLYYAPWQLAIVDVGTGAVRQPVLLDRDMFGPKWSADGTSIYARIEQPENTWLARIDARSGAVAYLTKGARFENEFDVGAGGHAVVIGGDASTPYELYAVDHGLRALSQANGGWLAGVTLQPYEDISYKTADGIEIHGLLVKPPGWHPGERVPTLLRLHGGPEYQFSHEFMFEWQYFAAHGYAVLAINPRGSTGRGFEFSKPIYADWAALPVADVLAGIGQMVTAGVADPDRLGVGGRSYGAMLTNYVIAADTRFKAAISEAGSANMLANYGVDEYAATYEMELGLPWRDADTYLKVSYPFYHADRIKTPTLFLCGEADLNQPCIGSQQMYQALRSQGVPTRLVRFPKEHHELVTPSYLEFRLKAYVEWYDRFVRR